MEGRRVGEGEDMRGKSLTGEDYYLGGRKHFGGGTGFLFGIFFWCGECDSGVFVNLCKGHRVAGGFGHRG
jgi:hypothetical protein